MCIRWLSGTDSRDFRYRFGSSAIRRLRNERSVVGSWPWIWIVPASRRSPLRGLSSRLAVVGPVAHLVAVDPDGHVLAVGVDRLVEPL